MRVGEVLHLITDTTSSTVATERFRAFAAPFVVWAARGRPGGGGERRALTIGAR